MKIDVVDNGGQWTHREWRVLKYLDIESEIISNETPYEDIKVDGLVLSGGAPRVADDSLKLGKTGAYLDNLKIPIFGICVGAQFIAKHFGSSAGAAENPEYGKTTIFVENENEIFKNIPSKFTAWESHNDEVKELGPELERLACSESCKNQAFKHKNKKIYGVQFHPEVEHTEYGVEIFKNFIELCKNE